jgi:sodium transport system permease protein
MNRNILITFKKEIRAITRDRKYLLTILLYPLIIPAFIILMGYVFDNNTESVYNVGINYELNNNEKAIINEISESYNLKFEENKSVDDLKSMFISGDLDCYIVKEKNKYTVYADDSSARGSSSYGGALAYLEGYNKFLSNNYLIGEDIDTEVAMNQITYEFNSLANEGENYFTTMLIQIALSYLTMIIIQTAINTSTDIIAGEKERGTLETVLTFPIKSNELIAGKFLAIFASCVTTALIGISLSIPSIMYIKSAFEEFKDLQFHISSTSIIFGIIVVLLNAALAAGVCIALSGRAKTFKEAQTNSSAVMFLGMISMFKGLLNMKSTGFLLFVPLANCGVVLDDIFFSNFDVKNVLIVLGVSILYIIIILKYISKQYKSEETLF